MGCLHAEHVAREAAGDVGELCVLFADVLFGGIKIGGDVPAGVRVFIVKRTASLLRGEDFFADGGGCSIGFAKSIEIHRIGDDNTAFRIDTAADQVVPDCCGYADEYLN